MSRFAKFVVAIAVVAMAIPAFAAVENVKVGADLELNMIYRDNFDFDVLGMDATNFTYIGTRVYMSADLTDNVTAMVRLINERDFGNDYLREVTGSLLVDLAYVKLGDIMTPGLDLTLGRQEIQIGEGLVVGSRYRALDYVLADVGTLAIDLGKQKAFDAIKVDYVFPMSDLSMTAFKAKILETYGFAGLGLPVGDLDLYGLAVKYDNSMLCLEPYFVYLRMDDTTEIDLMTLGARAGFAPMDNLKLKLELAKQLGDTNLMGGVDFEGWAGILGGSLTLGGEAEPTITASYSYFSGRDSADIDAWIPVFPSNVSSRVGKIAYPTLFQAGEGVGALGLTGLQVINVGFGIKPVEKIALGIDLFNLRALETTGADKGIGNEIDLSMKYMYTEDVCFGVNLGMLLVGDTIDDTYGVDAENPWQAIVSMNVAF